MTIKSVYDDSRTTTRDPKLLAERAGVTLKSAKAFLRDQQAAQTTSRWQRPAVGPAYAPTGAPAANWQADVIWFDLYAGANRKRRAILTVLNTTTRYAVARALLHAKAADTAAAMTEILDEIAASGRTIEVLRVDGGSEFAGAFKALMAARGITLEVSEAYTHYRLARTDAFHRTLRRRIGEHFERANTHNWVDALSSIVANLNETPHKTLSAVLDRKATPGSVTAKDEESIRLDEAYQAAAARRHTDELNIVPGVTRVRLLVAYTKAGRKDAMMAKSQNVVWTPEIYTVLSRNGPNSWIVDVHAGEIRVWPSYSLKITTKALLNKKSGHKLDLKVEGAKRQETRNISETEQKVAITAPARAKRAVRVNYKALAKGGKR
jgi:transposase InsO family protein